MINMDCIILLERYDMIVLCVYDMIVLCVVPWNPNVGRIR